MQIGTTTSPLGLLDLSSVVDPSLPHSPYQRAQTLGSLCHWWSQAKDEDLPTICQQFLQVPPNQLHELLSLPDQKKDSYRVLKTSQTQNKLEVHDHASFPEDHPLYSGRSISLVGVLGGVLFILLLIALISCVRQRSRYQEQETPINNHLSNYLRYVRQLRASQELMEQISASEQARVPPPDYTSVIKQKEKEEMELPSYSQALSRKVREGETSGSEGKIKDKEEITVVQSEVGGKGRESTSQ